MYESGIQNKVISLPLQRSEIILFVSLAFALLFLLLLVLYTPIVRKIKSGILKPEIKPVRDGIREDSVIELFDYFGTKILHENGKYTVNFNGVVTVYKNWNQVPPKFQAMVKELDKRSEKEKTGNDYFLEIINGIYYVTLPGGKKKKFNSLKEIPVRIRRMIGK
ncbi:MAG: hypothetical protein K8R21_04390 [Leptospira sp.]|nr:hypothetical protein [Leptospira sp.]